MNFDRISSLSKNLLLDVNFGIEREGLRVTSNGELSTKPHPSIFGGKKENPYITTDFSESQVEVITPVFGSAEETVEFLDSLYNIVALELEDEYIWPQSMPSISPEEGKIPLAVFSNQGNDGAYREYLSKKYGGKKQLISGLHINFSIGQKLLDTLYQNSKEKESLQDFKNNLYLKLTRNYLRYHWLLIYLFGVSNVIHHTFDKSCVAILEEMTEGAYSSNNAISFRNSLCGYRNKQVIKLKYSTLKDYVDSVHSYIKKGILQDIRELYSPIRLKGVGKYSLENLLQNGLEYVEIRTIDCNPFTKNGITVDDLKFIHLFLLYCLFKEEREYVNWQEESESNGKKVAVEGQNLQTTLMREGQAVSIQNWGIELLEELLDFNRKAKLPFESILMDKMKVMENHELTYSYRIARLCQDEGYIAAHMKLAKAYKEQAWVDRFRLKPYTDLELSTQILIKESIKRGIRFEILDRKENFISLTKGNQTEYIKQATKTSKDPYISVLMMENKSVTKKILERHHIFVPGGEEFYTLESARDSLPQWVNKPVVIKPKSTNFGIGISIFPEGANEVDIVKAIQLAFDEDSTILMEPFIKGKEYRFLVIGDKTVAILHRVPANVVGDGRSTIAQLIEQKNLDPLRGKGYKTPLEKINIDENMKLFLQQQNLTVDMVLPDGKLQFLRENSNISTGGDSLDVTDLVPEVFKEIAVKAAKAMGANICGADIMIEELENENSPYAIIELNFNPAIHIHSFPYKGKERNVAFEILQLLQLS